MKKTRRIVIAIMLVTVLCIGVGYSALNSSLTEKGSLTYKPDFKITWTTFGETGKYVTIDKGEITGDLDSGDSKILNFSVDTSAWVVSNGSDSNAYTVKAKIKNDAKYAANNVKVVAKDALGTGTNYVVNASIDGTTLAAGGETEVTITIYLKNYPKSDDKTSGATETFSFTVSADQSY